MFFNHFSGSKKMSLKDGDYVNLAAIQDCENTSFQAKEATSDSDSEGTPDIDSHFLSNECRENEKVGNFNKNIEATSKTSGSEDENSSLSVGNDDAILCVDSSFGVRHSAPLRNRSAKTSALDVKEFVSINRAVGKDSSAVENSCKSDVAKNCSILKDDDQEYCVNNGSKTLLNEDGSNTAATWQKQQWYFGEMTRSQAESLLNQNKKCGVFVVRDSGTCPGIHVISQVIGNDKIGYEIGHYKVCRNDSNAVSLNDSREFSDLQSLIEFYRTHPVGLKNGACLSSPCPKRGSDVSKEIVQNEKQCDEASDIHHAKDEKAKELLEEDSDAPVVFSQSCASKEEDVTAASVADGASILKSQCHNLQENLWYFGEISYEEASLFLQQNMKLGTFLVRDRDQSISTGPPFCLAVVKSVARNNLRVFQYKIHLVDGNLCLSEKANKFTNLPALVEFYQEKYSEDIGVKLTTACERSSSDTRNDIWKVKLASSISLRNSFGGTEFVKYWKGSWKGKLSVTVKIFLKTDDSILKQFQREMDFLKTLQHDNVVNMYGYEDSINQNCIVLESMKHLNMSRYLQDELSLSLLQRIHMAGQVASGMVYLEVKRIILRNLQAASIMVGDYGICKIANFSQAQFLKNGEYTCSKDEDFLALKWTAPEAGVTMKLTSKSDVWSFGVLLYEIFSNGDTPYADMSPLQALMSVTSGYRLPPPSSLGKTQLYEFMLKCWNISPDERPCFADVKMHLGSYYSSTPAQLLVLHSGVDT